MYLHHAYLTSVTGAAASAQHAFPYLTTLILLPAGVALVLLALPSDARRIIRAISIAASIAVLGIASAVLDQFQTNVSGYQMVSSHPWASGLGVSWSLGVDGISLFLVGLTALIFPLALLGAAPRSNYKSYAIWMLVLEAGCLGSFLSLDLLLFFLFFELTLIPVYFLIAGWGHEARNHAAMKFFVYTFVGSAMLLVGSITLAIIHENQTGVLTFDVRALSHTHLSGTAGVLLLCSFMFAFAIKSPIWPFHTWSPDGYAEAPASGSIVLGGVMAKLGTYGILRFCLGLFPHATIVLAPLFLTLGLVGIIYGGVVAAKQRNLKRLVAFSSLSHMGFIVLGAFAISGLSITGAVIEMLNHGLYTVALFLLIAMVYRRRNTLDVRHLSGIQVVAPVMAGVFTLVMLASIGVPGLNGFVGEFLILAGTFGSHRWWAVVAVIGVVISAIYMLWVYQQVFHGRLHIVPSEEGGSVSSVDPEGAAESERAPQTRSHAAVASVEAGASHFREMTNRERWVLVPLVVLIVGLGVYPKPVLDRIEPSVSALVAHVHQANSPRSGPTLTSALRAGTTEASK